MGTNRHGSINGSEIRCVYRVCRDHDEPVRLYVTRDDRIWIGYGDVPGRFSHIANVGDWDTTGTSRKAICRAANTW
jgi:hypothetical protein